MPKALLFNITGDKRKKLQFLLMQYGIAAVEAGTQDWNRPLGRILGKTGHYPASALEAPFFDEMLVLHDLTSQQFHGLLNGMQTLQATVVYKAVTTEHNLGWTPSRLYRELVAEHEAMNRR